jgi:hypothetical protein
MWDLLASSSFSLRGWWEDVNESPQWQDAAFFSLTAAYALVSAVALVRPHLPFLFFSFHSVPLPQMGWGPIACTAALAVLSNFQLPSSAPRPAPSPLLSLQIQLIRIQRRVPEFGWTTQKVFHLMNFLVNGGKHPINRLPSKSLSATAQFIHFSAAVRATVFGFHVHVFLLPTKVTN